MRKIDHVRKTIYIIVGILTIISLVFSLYKKISHAASSETTNPYYSDFPLPIGDNIGGTINFGSEELEAVYSLFSPYGIGPDKIPYILFYESTDPDHYVLSVLYVMNENPNVFPSVTYDVSNGFSSGSVAFYGGSIGVSVDAINNSATFYGTGNIRTLTLYLSNALESSPVQDFYAIKSGSILYYPIFSYYDDYIMATDDTVLFQPFGGGDITDNFSAEFLEQWKQVHGIDLDTDLPTVDKNPPSDPSSVPGWLGKILNGLATIGQTIKGGFTTLGGLIIQFSQGVWDRFAELGEKVENIYLWLTEDFDKNEFQNGLNSIPLISDLNGLKILVENSGMFNWSDVVPAQTVSFTFDFGGAVLPHSTNTIDFSWYSGTVKTICNAILCTFLVLGLLVTIINQLPSIIGGHSGDKGGGSDS